MINSVTRKDKIRQWFNEHFGRNVPDRIFHIINNLVWILFGFVALYPFLYVIVKSLEVYDVSQGAMRVTYSLSAYKAILSDGGIVWAFFFSIFVVLVSTAATLVVTYMCAYAMSKTYMKGRGLLMTFILIPMFFSGGLIPSYILIGSLGLKNNVLVYILPSLVGTFNILIVKNFIQGLPQSLEEAAMIDGAGHLKVMTQIFLPLSAPIIATIALWCAVGKWNDWMTGLLYVKDEKLYLMQNYLRVLLNFESGASQNPDIMFKSESVLMASIVVGIAPIIASFPFVQKHFIKGAILGSVKG